MPENQYSISEDADHLKIPLMHDLSQDASLNRAASELRKEIVSRESGDGDEELGGNEDVRGWKTALWVVLEVIEAIGDAVLLFTKHLDVRRFSRRLSEFLLGSLPLIAASGILIGLALAIQLYVGLSRFGATQYIPEVLGVSLVREIGPLLGGLLLVGQIGASVCSEVSSMSSSEQLAALQSLGVDPKRFLLSPMFFACLIAVPLLVTFMEFLGILSAGLISVYALGVKSALFISKTLDSIETTDMLLSLVKSILFGIIIVLVAFNVGKSVKGGAEKAGRSTTTAVVASSLLIILADYLITQGFLSLSGQGR
jgi:phospholipid/cholesterol/gamma-HCH transport system permease protein